MRGLDCTAPARHPGRLPPGRWLGVVLVATLLAVSDLGAQAVLRGRVVSDSSKRAVEGAEVGTKATARSVRTDRLGRFVLDGLPGGMLALWVRAVGFKPLELEAEIGANDTVDVEFSLTLAVQKLATLEVEARQPERPSAKMEDFERRRTRGFGTFMTRADLAKWDATPLSIPLRRIANLRLIPRRWDGGCGGGYAVAAGRGGEARQTCGYDAHACYLAIYVDGILFWSPGTAGPPNIDDYAAAGLQGIEVYRGPGELPAEFQQTGTACGAVLIWTRTGEAARPSRRPADSATIRPR